MGRKDSNQTKDLFISMPFKCSCFSSFDEYRIIRIHFTIPLEPQFFSLWLLWSLQVLHMWTQQENHSQSEAPCSLRWTDGMMVLLTPVVWSTSLCPTPTWQQRCCRSTVSAAFSYRLCKAELGVRLELRSKRRFNSTFMPRGVALHLLRISVGFVCR